MTKSKEIQELQYQTWKNNKLQALKYHRAICMLICGHSTKDVAKQLETTERSVQRWFYESDFNENFDRAIRLTFQSALSKAALYADRALDILIEISEDKEEPTKYRLEAIKQIFTICNQGNLQDKSNLNSQISSDLSEQFEVLSKFKAVHSQLESTDFATYPTPLEDTDNFAWKKDFWHLKPTLQNQKDVWMQLYPDEPFPSEETYREWFSNKS